MQKFLSIAIVLGVLGACDRPDPGVLRVGYIPIAECLPLYVAQEQGYFEAEGLEVDLEPLAGGAVILSSLISGSLDVGFSNVVSLALQRSEGSDFVSVYGATYETSEHQNHALVAKSSLASRDPAVALEGAIISVNTRRNIEELMTLAYLESIGLSADDVTLQPIGFPQMLPALESGAVDVASLVEPFITLASASSDREGELSSIGNHYLAISPRTLVATYVTSEELLASKSAEMRAFVRAMTRATEYITTNETAAREILTEYTRIPPQLIPVIGLSEFDDRIDTAAFEEVIARMEAASFFRGQEVPTAISMVAKFR